MSDFLAMYQKFAGDVTDASPDYHKYMAYGVLSSIIGNRVYLPWGDSRIYCNLWIILIGQSTIDRKSTSLSIAKRLIDNVSGKLIYPNEFSYEALVALMSDKPHGAFFFSEFMTLMKMLNREYMGPARSFLADMYDAPYKYERELSSKTYVIDHPAPCIFTATTQSWFIENIKESDIAGGLIPRFIIVPAIRRNKPMPRPPMADQDLRSSMLGELRDMESIKGPAYWTKDACEIHDKWYAKVWASGMGGRMAPFIGRLQGVVIKLAMMIEININRTLKVSGASMEEAVVDVNWLLTQLSTIEEDDIVFGKVNLDCKKLIVIIKAQSTKQITRRDLIRKSRLSKYELDNALATMEERGDIETFQDKGSGKKPITMYCVAEDDEY